MPATVSQILEQVRIAIGDNHQPFRYPNPELMNYIRKAEIAITSMRHDAIQTGTTTITSLPSPHLPTPNSTVNLRDKFEWAIVCYACQEALMTDAEHAANVQLAGQWGEKFMKALA